MLHKNVFNYLDRLLRQICDNYQPFGGKTVVTGGDWKQLTAVVENGRPEDQISASIKVQPLFIENFHKLRYYFYKY